MSGFSDAAPLMGAAAVGEVAGGLLNQAFTSYNRSRDYQNQKKLMDKSFKQSQEAQVNAAANTKAGLQKAGLSTASLAGMNANPSIGASPSAGSSASPQLRNQFDIQNLMNLKAQTALLESQKENLDADTDDKTQSAGLKGAQQSSVLNDTSRLRDEDKTNILSFAAEHPDIWTHIVETYYKGDEKAAFNDSTSGLYRGIQNAVGSESSIQKGMLDISVYAAQRNDSRVKAALVQMPIAQKSLLEADSGSARAAAAKLSQEYKLLKSYGPQTKETEIAETRQRIDNLKQEYNESMARVNEIIERADYWDSASKQAISQTVKNYVNSVTDVVGAVNDVLPTGVAGKAAKSVAKTGKKSATKKPIFGKRNDGTTYVKGWSTPDD